MKPVIRIHVRKTPRHTYLRFFAWSHTGDTFINAGELCLAPSEATALLDSIKRDGTVEVRAVWSGSAHP